MDTQLFAGIAVADFAAASAWYERAAPDGTRIQLAEERGEE